jgi:hypothetical protein
LAPPVRFARFEFRDRQLDAMSEVGAAVGAREALLQPAQPGVLAKCQA